jgi:hypothetical protein
MVKRKLEAAAHETASIESDSWLNNASTKTEVAPPEETGRRDGGWEVHDVEVVGMPVDEHGDRMATKLAAAPKRRCGRRHHGTCPRGCRSAGPIWDAAVAAAGENVRCGGGSRAVPPRPPAAAGDHSTADQDHARWEV